jgi:hypothetical protein
MFGYLERDGPRMELFVADLLPKERTRASPVAERALPA